MPNETGGLLLGYRGPAGEPVVTELTSAGPRGMHGPTSYVPDYAHDEREIARHYAASGRRLDYLGDWHTHPGARAYPSSKDVRAMRRIAAYGPARCSRPAMLILGGLSGHEWAPRAWTIVNVGTFCRRQGWPLRLRVIAFDAPD